MASREGYVLAISLDVAPFGQESKVCPWNAWSIKHRSQGFSWLRKRQSFLSFSYCTDARVISDPIYRFPFGFQHLKIRANRNGSYQLTVIGCHVALSTLDILNISNIFYYFSRTSEEDLLSLHIHCAPGHVQTAIGRRSSLYWP